MLTVILGTTRAEDFRYGGVAYRKVTSELYNAVAVTYKGKDINNEDYARKLTIPSMITISENNYIVVAIGHEAFYSCPSLTGIVLPETVRRIEHEAFFGCSGLKSITLPDSVKEIGYEAFSGCANLTSIKIPCNVKMIDNETFEECFNLKSITLPDSLETIGKEAFCYCTSLSKIHIPACITKIRNNAFTNCSRLERVVIDASEPPILGTEVFDGTSPRLKFYVPAASVEKYKETENWTTFNIQPIPEVWPAEPTKPVKKNTKTSSKRISSKKKR